MKCKSDPDLHENTTSEIWIAQYIQSFSFKNELLNNICARILETNRDDITYLQGNK